MKENTREYHRVTARLEPQTMEEIEAYLATSNDVRNPSELIRAAVDEYLQTRSKQYIGPGADVSYGGRETIYVKLAIPYILFAKVKWLAENDEFCTPVQLMLRLINKSEAISSLTAENMGATLEKERKIMLLEHEKKRQEDDLLGR